MMCWRALSQGERQGLPTNQLVDISLSLQQPLSVSKRSSAMRLNHINLPVSDVAKTRAFLEHYFDLRCLAEPDPDTVVVLADESQCIVTLSNFKRANEIVYPNGFHIGFMQRTREQVDAIFERLRGDGYEPGPRKHFHGAWTFYFKAPGGFTIEVGHQYELPSALSA